MRVHNQMTRRHNRKSRYRYTPFEKSDRWSTSLSGHQRHASSTTSLHLQFLIRWVISVHAVPFFIKLTLYGPRTRYQLSVLWHLVFPRASASPRIDYRSFNALILFIGTLDSDFFWFFKLHENIKAAKSLKQINIKYFKVNGKDRKNLWYLITIKKVVS